MGRQESRGKNELQVHLHEAGLRFPGKGKWAVVNDVSVHKREMRVYELGVAGRGNAAGTPVVDGRPECQLSGSALPTARPRMSRAQGALGTLKLGH